MAKQSNQWRNRIIGQGEESPEQLLANPNNWRVHGDSQKQAMTGVLNEVGYVQNVIVNQRTGYIVDGHLRVGLALKAGQLKVPVVYVDLSDDEEAVILATFDPISAMATTDQEMLTQLISDIDVNDQNLQTFLNELSGQPAIDPVTDGEVDDDVIPAVRESAVSKKGDMWIMGEHRLFVGDSTSKDDVSFLMGNEQADLLITDPPYNVSYGDKNASLNKNDGGKRIEQNIKNDVMSVTDFLMFLKDFYQAAFNVSRPGACFYVFYPDSETEAFHLSAKMAMWKISQVLVWVKNNHVLSPKDYNPRHEPIVYGWKEGAGHYYCKDFSQTTVIDDTKDLKKMSRAELETLCQSLIQSAMHSVIHEDKPAKAELHPTMKPVRLIQKLVMNSTKRGEIVLDCFGGSGTTLIACQKTGRKARLIELDEHYADVIVRRWQDWTGMIALHAEENASFEDIAIKRTGKPPKQLKQERIATQNNK